MTTSLTLANRQTLTAQIATLDFQINKLSKIFNAPSFKVGSLMISGKTAAGKEFNDLIVWRDQIPLPKHRLKEFLNMYAADLIYQRGHAPTRLGSPSWPFPSGRPDSCDRTRQTWPVAWPAEPAACRRSNGIRIRPV